MNLSSLDLNLLRVLNALLAEGSTVKAAARVGLSQSAVSAALGRLRHALGDPLFLRQGQRIVPTEFAQRLELPLAQTLDELQALLSQDETFDPASSEQRFRVSGSDYFAQLLMPRMASVLEREAPLMRVQLLDLVPDTPLVALEQGADLVLLPRVKAPPWADQKPVMSAKFVMIARRGHRQLAQAGLRRGDEVPIDLFCKLRFVLFSSEGNWSARTDRALEQIGRQRRVVMTLPVFTGVGRVVAESEIVAMIPENFASSLSKQMDLDVYQAPVPVSRVELCMVWHRRSSRSPGHVWFRDTVARILAAAV